MLFADGAKLLGLGNFSRDFYTVSGTAQRALETEVFMHLVYIHHVLQGYAKKV
jgi:hypothetical protein